VYSSQEKIYVVGLAIETVGAQFNAILSAYTKVLIKQETIPITSIAPNKHILIIFVLQGKNYAL
jgi:hypothetical protein